MSDFYVGQRVVCVDAVNPLRNGAVYRVSAVDYPCGCDSIAVGILHPPTDKRGIPIVVGLPGNCVRCGVHHIVPDSMRRFLSSRFRPLDNLEEQIERIEEEGAPVELEPEYA